MSEYLSHPQPLKNKRILIIDDVLAPRKMLKRLLVQFGEMEFEEVDNGIRAKEKLTLSPYDLVFCDIRLPDVNGLDILEWLRKTEGYNKSIPYVVISSDMEKDQVIRAKACGISGYLVKPFNFGDLYQTLSSTFNWSPEIQRFYEIRHGI